MDGSERIAQVAQRLVDANGLSQAGGGPVTILQGRLEQLADLPVDKVSAALPSVCRLTHCCKRSKVVQHFEQ